MHSLFYFRYHEVNQNTCFKFSKFFNESPTYTNFLRVFHFFLVYQIPHFYLNTSYELRQLGSIVPPLMITLKLVVVCRVWGLRQKQHTAFIHKINETSCPYIPEDNFTLRKNPTAELGIEPGTSCLVASDSAH